MFKIYKKNLKKTFKNDKMNKNTYVKVIYKKIKNKIKSSDTTLYSKLIYLVQMSHIRVT